MKPNNSLDKKLDLKKHTIQRLDNNKMAAAYAGVAQEEAGPTTFLVSGLGLLASAAATTQTEIGIGIYVACTASITS